MSGWPNSRQTRSSETDSPEFPAKHPQNSEVWALVETLAIGCHAIHRGNPQPQETVVVFGAGPTGLSVVETGQIDTRPWLTHTAEFDDVPRVFPEWMRTKAGVIKACVSIGWSTDTGAGGLFRFVHRVFRELGRMLLLAVDVFRALPQVPRRRRAVAEQLFEIGNASLFTACVLSFFIGGVLALQAGPLLTSRGLGNQVGGLVALSMCRELAPVMMGILLAGRIGSAMAAELGSMQVYQEIDALQTLNIRPVPYLLMPRILALTVALPCLVMFSNLVGWMGGATVAAWNADVSVPWSAFFANLRETLLPRHVLNGLFKSVIFAMVVGVVSCHHGMATVGGPRGVGRSVTKAVVNSIILILILDYVLTRLFLPWDRW